MRYLSAGSWQVVGLALVAFGLFGESLTDVGVAFPAIPLPHMAFNVAGCALMFVSFAAVCRERRELRHGLASALDGLSQQERLATVGALSAGVVHDIRNMLTAVGGNLELAQGSGGDEVLRAECVADALLASRRIHQLTDALHAYARPCGPGEEVVEPLAAIAEEALRLVRPLARSGPALFFAPTHPGGVRHAPGELQQVLVNLLQNAISVSKGQRDGEVSLRIDVNGHTVRATVRDNGPGIPASIHDKLFSPFATSRPHAGGTGLGLFISRRIAKRCGGNLTARNLPGGGAEFVLELPLLEPTDTADAASRAQPPPAVDSVPGHERAPRSSGRPGAPSPPSSSADETQSGYAGQSTWPGV